MSAARLYTPQLLAATVELTQWPPLENAPLHGSARSATCGSTLAIDLSVDSQSRVETIGLRVRACAVGQASATVFARHIAGMDLIQIGPWRDRLAAWLEGQGPMPDWPDLDLIAPAMEYRARHGAIMLPWNAAIAALSSAPQAG